MKCHGLAEKVNSYTEQHESCSLVRAQKYEANYNQAKRQSIVDKNFLDEKAS